MNANGPAGADDELPPVVADTGWGAEPDMTDEVLLGHIRVAGRLRELIALLHSGRATLEEMETLERLLAPAIALAAALPPERVREIEIPEQDGEPNSEFRSTSPVSGIVNPIAPPLAYDEAASQNPTVVADVTFGLPYEGPPGHVHGGWVAAVLDEVLGRAQRFSGQMGMTGTLDIRYRSPSPLHRSLRVSATLESVVGRKATVSGKLADGDTVLASAIGVFISVDFDAMRNADTDRLD